jgi:uncharacterized membrane protein
MPAKRACEVVSMLALIDVLSSFFLLRGLYRPYVGNIDAVQVAKIFVSKCFFLSAKGITYFIKSMKVMQGRNLQSSFFRTALLSNAISTSDLSASRGYRWRISSCKLMPPDFSTCSTVLISFSNEDLCCSSERRSRLLVMLKVGVGWVKDTQYL